MQPSISEDDDDDDDDDDEKNTASRDSRDHHLRVGPQ